MTQVENEQDVRLIARVISLLPASLNDKPWDSRLDYDLVGLHSITKNINRSYRNLQDMVIMTLFANRKLKANPTDMIKLSLGYILVCNSFYNY